MFSKMFSIIVSLCFAVFILSWLCSKAINERMKTKILESFIKYWQYFTLKYRNIFFFKTTSKIRSFLACRKQIQAKKRKALRNFNYNNWTFGSKWILKICVQISTTTFKQNEFIFPLKEIFFLFKDFIIEN